MIRVDKCTILNHCEMGVPLMYVAEKHTYKKRLQYQMAKKINISARAIYAKLIPSSN